MVVDCISITIWDKSKSLQISGNRLQGLHSQDAFCLLRNALAIPKVLYNLRTSPCFLSSSLEVFDSLLRSLLGTILNIHHTDTAWTQAPLPVRAGGLGVQSTTQLAPSACLASVAGCAHLIHQILPQQLQNCHPRQLKMHWSPGNSVTMNHLLEVQILPSRRNGMPP